MSDDTWKSYFDTAEELCDAINRCSSAGKFAVKDGQVVCVETGIVDTDAFARELTKKHASDTADTINRMRMLNSPIVVLCHTKGEQK